MYKSFKNIYNKSLLKTYVMLNSMYVMYDHITMQVWELSTHMAVHYDFWFYLYFISYLLVLWLSHHTDTPRLCYNRMNQSI